MTKEEGERGRKKNREEEVETPFLGG